MEDPTKTKKLHHLPLGSGLKNRRQYTFFHDNGRMMPRRRGLKPRLQRVLRKSYLLLLNEQVERHSYNNLAISNCT